MKFGLDPGGVNCLNLLFWLLSQFPAHLAHPSVHHEDQIVGLHLVFILPYSEFPLEVHDEGFSCAMSAEFTLFNDKLSI